jgi:hypothetical protein
MTIVFTVPLIVGILGILAWIGASAYAATSDGGDHWDPERRIGRGGRYAIAAAFGFGLAGMSALYAGWPSWLTLIAGGAGAVGLAGLSAWAGPRPVS